MLQNHIILKAKTHKLRYYWYLKSRNQDFKATPAWSISSGQMESGPAALPGFKCWRAAANSLCKKLSEIFSRSGVVALQRSDSS